jgi:hypothetical protein
VLRVTRECVYRNKDLLGGRYLGAGRRPRLRFDLDQALAAWAAPKAETRGRAEYWRAAKVTPEGIKAPVSRVFVSAPGRI